MSDLVSVLAARGARASWFRQLAALVAGTAVLALASRVTVPMFPVPMTLQVLAVMLVGALFGPRLGTLTVLAWLAEGLVGLPVFAGGAGPAYMMGPTAGYLFAFPLVALIAGVAVRRGCDGRHPIKAFAGFVLASIPCLFFGWAWLAHLMGAEAAFMVGVLPFILGDLVKCALAAATLSGWAAMRQSIDWR